MLCIEIFFFKSYLIQMNDPNKGGGDKKCAREINKINYLLQK